MVNAPTVSVLVPVYNVEPYLRECLDSLCGQSFKDFEAICIDDGSTDSSGAILREYEAKDSRLRVMHIPNGGYGHAVNLALSEAHGSWVAIVEPDDVMEPLMLESLLTASDIRTDVDIVKGSFRDYYHEDGEVRLEVPRLERAMPGELTVINPCIDSEVLYHHPSIWTCLYRRSFLKEHDIRMVEAPGAGWTDNPWFYDTMLRARSVVWLPESVYRYRQSESFDSRRVSDMHLPFDRLREIRTIINATGNADNPEVLLPTYKRTFAYIDSLIDKWGFSETDADVRAEIDEAIGSMDASLVLSSPKLAHASKLYYSDITGRRLGDLPPHGAAEDVDISLVLLTDSDRRVLWPTIESISSQVGVAFEVLCVDNESRDRGREICVDVAKKDQRFRVLDGAANSLESVCDQARAPWLCFIRPGEVWANAHQLARMWHATRYSHAHLLVPTSSLRGTQFPAHVDFLALCHSIQLHPSGCLFRQDFAAMLAHSMEDADPAAAWNGAFMLRVMEWGRTEYVNTRGLRSRMREAFDDWRLGSTAEALASIEARCEALAQCSANVPALREAMGAELMDAFGRCGTAQRRRTYFEGLATLVRRYTHQFAFEVPYSTHADALSKALETSQRGYEAAVRHSRQASQSKPWPRVFSTAVRRFSALPLR